MFIGTDGVMTKITDMEEVKKLSKIVGLSKWTWMTSKIMARL